MSQAAIQLQIGQVESLVGNHCLVGTTVQGSTVVGMKSLEDPRKEVGMVVGRLVLIVCNVLGRTSHNHQLLEEQYIHSVEEGKGNSAGMSELLHHIIVHFDTYK